MPEAVYKEMLKVMQGRGGMYTGADLPEFYTLMEALFTPKEAEVNNVMNRKAETLSEIAAKLKREDGEVAKILEQMADKGLCATFRKGDTRFYMGSAFMPGIFEYQFLSGKSTEREIRIARLIYEYKQACEKADVLPKINYPVTRVIPVQKSIEAGNVLRTYDQVSTYIDKYDSIAVGTCYCRQAAKLRGEDIHGMPLDVCMWFGHIAEYMCERLGGKMLSKAEAREVLDRSDKAGLLHMGRNTAEDIDFVCNCDRWHCGVVTRALKNERPGLFFNSGFAPVFDADKCIACETCIDRCPPEALKMKDSLPEADMGRCFGCGLCATGCEQEAVSMKAKEGYSAPPKDVRELVMAMKAAM